MAEVEGVRPAQAARNAAPVTIFLCFLVAMLEGFDIQAVGLVAPRLAEVAHLGRDQLGLVFSMANVGMVTGAALGGWAADKLGRKPVFLTSVLAFGIFTLATMFAADYATLLIVRVLTGLGLGAAMPNMIAMAAEVSRPERRGATTTAMFCGMPLGGGLSAIYTANLPAGFDWRSVFLIGGIIPLVVAILIVLLMAETRSQARGKEAGPVGVAHALFGEGRAMSTSLLWLTFFPTLMLLYILLNWLPSMVADKGVKPYDLLIGGLHVGLSASFTFNWLGAIGALMFGPAIDRFDFRWPTIAGYIALFAALVGLANAVEAEPVLAYAGVAGFALLGAQYGLYSVAAAFYPAAFRGVGAGFSVAIGRIGAILGPIVAGEMLAHGMDAAATILALAPLAAIAGISVFLLSFRQRAEA